LTLATEISTWLRSLVEKRLFILTKKKSEGKSTLTEILEGLGDQHPIRPLTFTSIGKAELYGRHQQALATGAPSNFQRLGSVAVLNRAPVARHEDTPHRQCRQKNSIHKMTSPALPTIT